jgi:hypothetical protein
LSKKTPNEEQAISSKNLGDRGAMQIAEAIMIMEAKARRIQRI